MRTIQVYSLPELKVQFPKAFAKVLKGWAESQDEWLAGDETLASLAAVVEFCGFNLDNYQIRPWDRSWLKVSQKDEEIEYSLGWFIAEAMEVGYTHHSDTGKLYFPGRCPFTGYCSDEDFMESIYNNLVKGYTMEECLQKLATIAQRHCEDDYESQQNEESMLVNWESCEFTEDGIMVA